jgi:hypothetical protein
MNDSFRNNLRGRRWLGVAVFGLPLSTTVLGAETHFAPYVGTQFEYNSNVFSISSPDLAFQANNTTARDDQIMRYLAGFKTSYGWGNQQLDAAVDGAIVDYSRFNQLNHKEYGLDGGYTWKVLDTADGAIRYKQTGAMTPFADVGGNQFELQTTRTGDGSFNVNVAPEWRLESGADITQTKSPRIGAPNYISLDTAGRLAMLYTGFTGIAFGLRGQYDYNQFQDAGATADATPQYHQETLDFTFSSKIDGLSNFNSDFGYTRRRSDGPIVDTVTGFNGKAEYIRFVSVKTRFEINVYHSVEPTDVIGAFTAISTGAATSLTWSPTPKINLSAIYTYEKDKYQTLSDPTLAATPDRKDSFQDTRGTLDYQLLEWLGINSYVEYQDRRSNFDFDAYNSLVAGVGLRATFD